MLADARASGMDQASIAALAEDLGVEDGVLEENAPAVLAFLQVSTQWRTAVEPDELGFRTRWIGLDYQGVATGLGVLGIELTADLFWRLQVMELAALAMLNGRGN